MLAGGLDSGPEGAVSGSVVVLSRFLPNQLIRWSWGSSSLLMHLLSMAASAKSILLIITIIILKGVGASMPYALCHVLSL